MLDAREALAGVAVTRVYTSAGQIVQLNHGCNEWAGYTEGLLIEADLSRVVRFTGGPFFEIPGFLIVEQQLQIGADGGEPWTNNTPAKGVIQGTNGAVWVTRVVAIDLATGVVHDEPGWDSFAPVAQLDGKGQPTGKVVFAGAGEPLEYEDPSERVGGSVHLWDVARHKIESLGSLKGPLMLQVGDGRMLIGLGAGELLELSASGKRRRISSATAPILSPKPVELPSPAVGDLPPSSWVSPDGRAIMIEQWGRLTTPQVGLCGVDTALELGGLLLLDDGLYEWPADLPWPL